MKRFPEIQLILLIATGAVMAQATPYGSPQRMPLTAGQQPLVRPSFQMNLNSGVQAPQFQIVSDQSAASMPYAGKMPGQPTPAVQTPTLAKRPGVPTPASPQPVPASPQLTFRGPPIQPAKPFIGWKFGQAARADESSSSAATGAAHVQLVPQYSLHLADNPAPPKTRVASNPSPQSMGLTGKFFSLQNNGRNQASRTCPKCGRQKNTAVANANNGRQRR